MILCPYDEVDDYLMSRTIQLQHESANEASDVGSPERPIPRCEPDGKLTVAHSCGVILNLYLKPRHIRLRLSTHM